MIFIMNYDDEKWLTLIDFYRFSIVHVARTAWSPPAMVQRGASTDITICIVDVYSSAIVNSPNQKGFAVIRQGYCAGTPI